jgi:CheY-like chemotaxis protein
MPAFDGFEATAALREREEKAGGGHVPIIAMTADVEDSFRERCLASCMDAYLSKPFDQKQLASVLVRFIPRRSAHSRRNRIR